MALLAKRLEVRVVDWPRQEEIEGIVALIVVKDAKKSAPPAIPATSNALTTYPSPMRLTLPVSGGGERMRASRPFYWHVRRLTDSPPLLGTQPLTAACVPWGGDGTPP